MKKKSPFRFLVYIVILAVLGFGVFSFGISYLKSPADPNGKIRAFVIQKGETVSEVAKKLEEEGFIRSALIFKWEFKNMGSPTIEAGDFKISSAMSVSEIIENLRGGAVDKWVTLIEGWRVEEIARKLNFELGIDEEEFIKAAEEGYSSPDTYLFNKDATAQTIAQTLKSTFEQRFDEDLRSKTKAKGLSEREAVILASIVEREGRSEKVRTEVAGVLLKRLKIGMKLDADATVQYAKDSQTLKSGKKPEKFWQPITQAEYSSIKSDYNTYLVPGLPPGPICNPSLASLRAVANADTNTPYLFYYHDSEGNSHYARTLDEHNANVAKYR